MKISLNVDNKIVYLCDIPTRKCTYIEVLKHVILYAKIAEMALLSYAFGVFSFFLEHNFNITKMIDTSLIEIDDYWYMTTQLIEIICLIKFYFENETISK